MEDFNVYRQLAAGSLPECVESFDVDALDSKLPHEKPPAVLVPLVSASVPSIDRIVSDSLSSGNGRAGNDAFNLLSFSRHNNSELLGLTSQNSLAILDISRQKVRFHVRLPVTSDSDYSLYGEHGRKCESSYCRTAGNAMRSGAACLSLSDDGPLSVFGFYDGGVSLYDLRFWSSRRGQAIPALAIPECHNAPVRSLKIGVQQHSQLLVSAGEDCWMKIFDLRFPFHSVIGHGCHKRSAAPIEAGMLRPRVQTSSSSDNCSSSKEKNKLLSAAFSSDGSIAAAAIARCSDNLSTTNPCQLPLSKDCNDGEVQVVSPAEEFRILKSFSAADGCVFNSIEFSCNAKYLLTTVGVGGLHCSRCLRCTCSSSRCCELCGVPQRVENVSGIQERCTLHRAHIMNLQQSNFNISLKSPADGAVAFADAFCLQIKRDARNAIGNESNKASKPESVNESQRYIRRIYSAKKKNLAERYKDKNNVEIQMENLRPRCLFCKFGFRSESSESEGMDCEGAPNNFDKNEEWDQIYHNCYTMGAGFENENREYIRNTRAGTCRNMLTDHIARCGKKNLWFLLHPPGSRFVERRRRRFWRCLQEYDNKAMETKFNKNREHQNRDLGVEGLHNITDAQKYDSPREYYIDKERKAEVIQSFREDLKEKEYNRAADKKNPNSTPSPGHFKGGNIGRLKELDVRHSEEEHITGNSSRRESSTECSSLSYVGDKRDIFAVESRYFSFPRQHPQLSQFLCQCGPNHPAFCRAEANVKPLICKFWGGLVVGSGGCTTTEACTHCNKKQNLYGGIKLWDAASGVVLSWTEGSPSFDSALACIEPHPDLSTGLVATGGHRHGKATFCLFGLEKRDSLLINALKGRIELNVDD